MTSPHSPLHSSPHPSRHSIVVHGHYYQPPREDPWLGEILPQATAAPYHDWNERITAECYRPVTAARVLDASGAVQHTIDTLAYTSFDFGPTLLTWLERHARDVYDAVLAADRESVARLGRGNAIAQAYHHAILPLASRRDKETEVRWGIADFRRRFGRAPEGMWLPETAVDDETLDVLAEHGIAFTIVAPHQVTNAPADGRPGVYRTASGQEIALFVYDGALSHAIAFGNLLGDGDRFAARLAARADAADAVADGDVTLTSVATDGETFGHHHTFGEMALARAIEVLESRDDVTLENFASFLARHPAREEIRLVSPSSWSCVHGVERWRDECGCGATEAYPSQAWRAPLRAAIEELAGALHAIFATEGLHWWDDPWEARNRYGEVDFNAAAIGATEPRARALLEMERYALRMVTSCGWFFDDLDRLEPLQIMRYAARAIELAGARGDALAARFHDRLGEIHGNDPASGSARDIYLRARRTAA